MPVLLRWHAYNETASGECRVRLLFILLLLDMCSAEPRANKTRKGKSWHAASA